MSLPYQGRWLPKADGEVYVSDGHILFVPAKRIWKEKQAKEGRKKPLFGITPSAVRRTALCHIIKTETLVCAPRFPLRTLLPFAACSAARRPHLVLVFQTDKCISTITSPNTKVMSLK